MTDRRARFLEVLGIAHEWLPRALPPAADDPGAVGAADEAVPAATTAAALQTEQAPVVPAAPPASDAPATPVAPMVQARAADSDSSPAIQPVAEAPPAPVAQASPERPVRAPAPAEPAVASAPEGALSARAEGIAALDWPALEAQVSACTACKLCSTRTQTVFGVGDRQAEWMLVGEAPGENEDKQGEPFVGQAGKLLDNMLASLGLARGRNVFIANVLKCRPPGNRNPELDEVAQCEPYLKRQIALVRPRLIVVLGRIAAQSLLRTTTPISKLRGSVHSYEGIPVVVTYHPAYLLRTPADKARAWDDLCLAREVHDHAGAEG